MASNLRVASLNCHSFKRNIAAVKALCTDHDLVFLQETMLFDFDLPLLNSVDLDFLAYGVCATKAGDGLLRGRPKGGLAVLCRKVYCSFISFPIQPDERLQSLCVSIAGVEYLFANVYMPVCSIENLPEFSMYLGKLLALANDYDNVCFVGDFNANTCSDTLFSKEIAVYAALNHLILSDVVALEATSFTFMSHTGSTSWLDHIVCSQAMHLMLSNIRIRYDVFGSDHFPLVFEFACHLQRVDNLSFSSPRVVNPPRINWESVSEAQKGSYVKGVERRILSLDPSSQYSCSSNPCNNPDHCRKLESLYLTILGILLLTACETLPPSALHGPRSGSGAGVVPGWSNHVKVHYLAAKRAFLSWVSHGRRIGDEFDRIRRLLNCKFRSSFRWCKKHTVQLRATALARALGTLRFNAFWKCVAKVQRVSVPKAAERVGPAIGPVAIAELWRGHFSEVFSSVKSDVGGLRRQAFIDSQLNPGEQLISVESISRVVSGLAGSKSGGLDGITANHIKFAGPTVTCILSVLFNGFLNHHFVPEALTEVCLVPIPKTSSGDMSSVSSYRPIALAAVVSKVFEKCLYTILEPQLRSSHYQFGFKEKSSTDFCVFILQAVIQYFWMFSSPVFVCFIDAKAAFDRVNHEKLLNKMVSRGIDPRVTGTLAAWFQTQQFRVKWSGVISQPFAVLNGVRQGGVLSPLLYNLYVDDLNLLLVRTGVGCFIQGLCFNNLSYADDLAILAPTVAALNKLLAVCDEFALIHDVVFNTKKTLCMAFIPRGFHLKIIPDALLSGSKIQVVQHFKYLGFTFSSSLSAEAHVSSLMRSLSIRANILIRRFGSCEAPVKSFLFRAYCTPLYCLPLACNVSVRCENSFRVLYNNSFRWLHGLPWNCSASGMFVGEGLPSFGELRRRSTLSLQTRILQSPSPLLRILCGPQMRLSLPIWLVWTRELYAGLSTGVT